MKKIIFIRHGKAKNSSESGNDFDRKLSIRGQSQAEFIGKELEQRNLSIDQIISSNSVRTTQTIGVISDILGYPTTKITYEQKLYLTDLKNYLNICFNLDEKHDLVVICGHNFGISDCVSYFSDTNIQLSTSGTAIISFGVDSWREISEGMGDIEVLNTI